MYWLLSLMTKMAGKTLEICTMQDLSNSSNLASTCENNVTTNIQSNPDKHVSKDSSFQFKNLVNGLKIRIYHYVNEVKIYYNGFYGALALLLCVTSSFPITLIPVHDNVINPKYWYEVIISYPSQTFMIAASFVVRAQTIFNCFNKTMTRIILDLGCSSFLSAVVVCCLLHSVWTGILNYLEPFPWKCVCMGYICSTVLAIRFWFAFPKELIQDQSFRNRRRAFFLYLAWIGFVGILLLGLCKLFKEMPWNTQWLLGIVVPLLKEINDRLTEKMISNASTSKNIADSKLVAKIDAGILFSFWITIVLATVATQITGYVLLGINSFINLALCLKARYLERKICSSIGEAMKNHSLKKEVVAELILNETIEVLVPLAFIASYTIAFYGPNYDKLGSLGCSYWTFKKVEDLHSFLKPVLFMEMIDFGTAVISGILLWKFCRINILKEYCTTIKRYWLVVAFSGAYNIASVLVKDLFYYIRIATDF